MTCKLFKIHFLISLVALFLAACGSESGYSSDSKVAPVDPSTVVKGTMTDERDGQIYKTVKIGDQTWMAENLNYRYLEPTADEDSSSFCYENDPAKCDLYGRLYLWSAAMDSAGIIKGDAANGCGYHSVCSPYGTVRGVCPQGWHLPSKEEWDTLIVAVNDSFVEYPSETAGTKLKSTFGWNGSGNGTDDFGFSALPAGFRENIWYYYESEAAYFWSSTENHNYFAYYMYLSYGMKFAHLHYGDIYDETISGVNESKTYGFSVRCLKD